MHAHRLAGPGKVRLADFDTEGRRIDRDKAEATTQRLAERLAEFQELLHAARGPGVLVVLQGMDTSGKDGAIRSVMRPLSPQGVRVVSFKAPTEEELAHDFLWRVHPHAPGRGTITIFNRSHYEDVLAARVRGLVPKAVWKRRYGHINAFERLLADQGTVVLKFFLHISKEEQGERLRARQEDPDKAWKVHPGDWEDRGRWDDYEEAYEDALGACSTPEAPWYIVPSDRKWYRNLAISEALVEALEPLADDWRKAMREQGRRNLGELRAYRAARRERRA